MQNTFSLNYEPYYVKEDWDNSEYVKEINEDKLYSTPYLTYKYDGRYNARTTH